MIVTNHEKGWRAGRDHDKDNPDYFYNFSTHIKEADENGKIRAVVCDNNKEGLQVQKDFWEELLRVAIDKLQKLEFKESELCELADFIPFLCEKDFIPLFVKKLRQKASAEQMQQITQLIALCFDERYADLERIASELVKNKIHSFLMEQTLLKKECQNYRNYLLAVMKKELQAGDSAAEDADELIQEFIVSRKLPRLSPERQANVKLDNALEIYTLLGNLMTFFKNKESSNFQNITDFSELFNSEASKNIFEKGADSVGRKFLKAIGHILLSLVTLSIYALASAWQTKKKYNSYKFWKSPEAIYADRIKELLPPPDSELRLIK